MQSSEYFMCDPKVSSPCSVCLCSYKEFACALYNCDTQHEHVLFVGARCVCRCTPLYFGFAEDDASTPKLVGLLYEYIMYEL
jgi:hypothetical protein